jgi:hypothetical protein
MAGLRTVTSSENVVSPCAAIVCCAAAVPASAPPGATIRVPSVTVTAAPESLRTAVRAVTRADAGEMSDVAMATPHGATWTASMVSSQT